MKNKKKGIVLGQYIGIIFLVIVSLVLGIGLNKLRTDYIFLLGAIPIILGIKEIFNKEENNENIISTNRVALQVFLITVSNGADNVGIYTPMFLKVTPFDMIIIVIVFMILTGVFCILANILSTRRIILSTIEKYKRILTPAVFILIGVFVIINGIKTLG